MFRVTSEWRNGRRCLSQSEIGVVGRKFLGDDAETDGRNLRFSSSSADFFFAGISEFVCINPEVAAGRSSEASSRIPALPTDYDSGGPVAVGRCVITNGDEERDSKASSLPPSQ